MLILGDTFEELIGDRYLDNPFFSATRTHQAAKNSLLCIGLDPYFERLPAIVKQDEHPIFKFNKEIIEATRDIACCYKPQIAHYSAVGAEKDLELTITFITSRDIPVLLDAKRGDVGSSAEMYAKELFERYGADAITVNPYLGLDSMEPYLSYSDKGVFILCRTSNPGSAELQNLRLEGDKLLYEHIAESAATTWNYNGNVGLVVGATKPAELKRIREIVGDTTLLLPGVGSQGADVGIMMDAGAGGGMLVSSSRAIIFASPDADFGEAARNVAIATRDEINQYRIAA